MARSAKQIAALAKAQKASAIARKAKSLAKRDMALGDWLDSPTKANAKKATKAVKTSAPKKPRKTKLDRGIGSFLDNPGAYSTRGYLGKPASTKVYPLGMGRNSR